VEENLPANALAQGDFIKESLKSIIGKYPFMKDARGRGLFNIIE
jgi:4-aminobutyrate aminotransferase-like enzyme